MRASVPAALLGPEAAVRADADADRQPPHVAARTPDIQAASVQALGNLNDARGSQALLQP